MTSLVPSIPHLLPYNITTNSYIATHTANSFTNLFQEHMPKLAIPTYFPKLSLSIMAWHSSGTTNTSLIQNLFSNNLITTPLVKEAFLRVDRAHYCPSTSSAYQDSPQSIGWKATISAPHMHASAVENLSPFLLPDEGENGRGRRVLDVGSGSGYLTHIFAEMVCADGGEVVGIEHIEPLRALGKSNMSKSDSGREYLRNGKVKFVKGDGRKGWDDGKGGWDAIHVGAAAKVIHEELIQQLKKPGRMFIPVDGEDGSGNQSVWTIDKHEDGRIEKRKLYGVRYVPLTDAEE